MPKGIGWKFPVLFALCYVTMYASYALVPEAVLHDEVYHYLIVYPAKSLLDWIVSDEHVVAFRNCLQSAHANLMVVRGCDGAGVLFLLIAAIIACRAPGIATLRGIAGATILIYVINELRIVALFLVDVYHPAWFTPTHVYVIPLLMIGIGTFYFGTWSIHRRTGVYFDAQT